MNGWSLVYKKAIADDGTLLFPERLSKEFLERARRTMGSYLFANQYQNEVIPDDERRFKKHWLRYHTAIPENTYRFGFIDPAIGQREHSDYTGFCVVDVDSDGLWWVRLARRERLTPTQQVELMFDLHAQFRLQALGVEVVAYQEALLYLVAQEMQRRKTVLPVKDVRRNAVSKETRILGLVPRFEWGRITLAQGLTDLEDELLSFPRGSHDDILDSLASLEELVFYPEKEKEKEIEQPHSPSDPSYEKWIIRQYSKRQAEGS